MKRTKKTTINLFILMILILSASTIVFVKDYGSDNNNEVKENEFSQLENKEVLPDLQDINSQEESYGNVFKNIKVKGIYLTGNSAGNDESINHAIDLVKNTELNALVIDIKDNGIVNYNSDLKLVNKYNCYRNLYNVDKLINNLHKNNVYVIGRIVCFRDTRLAKKRNDLAVLKPNGKLWLENGMIAWTNPYKKEVWQYNIDIAKEAVSKGFDEIQFDYVRFPTAANVYYGADITTKSEAISSFLSLAEVEIKKVKDVPISADVFGIIFESNADGENIGQDIEKIGKEIDYICPMIYPSHYANSSNGMLGNGVGQEINGVKFTAPDLNPYGVVYNTLVTAKNKISKIKGYKAKLRPYLQDFTASYLSDGYYQEYKADEVRDQIRAVYDSGFEEWILWDGRNIYSEEALSYNKKPK
jgi:hypothetical protein